MARSWQDRTGDGCAVLFSRNEGRFDWKSSAAAHHTSPLIIGSQNSGC